MAKLTKAEFFALRDKQREEGLIPEYTPENYDNDLLPTEEKAILDALGNQTRGIFRAQDIGLTGLLCVELYIGKKVKARRNKVDEIDNVTVWRYSR